MTKHFGPEPVLAGVSCEIRPGDRVGLVGPNGAGKSTLLRIVTGQEQADSGDVELHPSASLAYLEQHPEFLPGQTLWDVARDALSVWIAMAHEAEEVAHRLAAATDDAEHRRLAQQFDRLQHELHRHDAYNLDHRIERVLDGLGFSSDSYQQPVDQLSGGQQNRLLLARLLLSGADLLLLDEPSNHLDVEATQWLEGYLAECEQAILLVSHDRYFLDRVTNRTFELYDGTVDCYTGNFSAYWRQKAERVEVERRTYERQQEFIGKTEDFIRRNLSGQKHTQAEDRKKKLERVELVAPPRMIVAPPMGFPPASRTGDVVVRVEHLSKAYDRPLFDDLSFDILRGERWGILGPNGSGKTTLLRCLVGEVKPEDGRVILGTGVKLGYFDQRLIGLDPEMEVVDAIRPHGKEFVLQQRRDLLARFGLTGDQALQKVGSLSGGERNRASLARLAAADANLLVLDEPTNHLDLWARDALERSLSAFEGSVLLVSHDRYFLNRVVDHLLVVEPHRFRVIEGNYDTYLALVRSAATSDAAAGVTGKGRDTDAPSKSKDSADGNKSATRDKSKGTKPKRKFPYRKVEDLEAEIMQHETAIEEIHASLAKPEVLRDGDKVRQLNRELDEHQAVLPNLYAHWEEATELN
ncbi:MAG: ABC-F family ATP-binding cassette domain-containing protein [Pirellulales bacterium]|nr:ABC-F family ATP-binding cassette domain-containing protein [Pirellulales bacterium]